MPNTPQIPRYEYDSAPSVETGPFAQYLQGGQYQNYLQNYQRPGIPQNGSQYAGYLAKFMEGLQHGRAQALVNQQAKESGDAQKVNDLVKGMQEAGHDPKDIAKVQQYIQAQHVGYSLNNLADHGKQNPLAKAAHGILSVLAGGGNVDEKDAKGLNGKNVKQVYHSPEEVIDGIRKFQNGDADIDQHGNLIEGAGVPLKTMDQKYRERIQGSPQDPATGNQPVLGFADKWAQGLRDVQNELKLPPEQLPTHQQMLERRPGLVAEDIAIGNEHGKPIFGSMLQPGVNQPQPTMQSQLTNSLYSQIPKPISAGTTPPPIAPSVLAGPSPGNYLNGNPFTQTAPITPIPQPAQ